MKNAFVLLFSLLAAFFTVLKFGFFVGFLVEAAILILILVFSKK